MTVELYMYPRAPVKKETDGVIVRRPSCARVADADPMTVLLYSYCQPLSLADDSSSAPSEPSEQSSGRQRRPRPWVRLVTTNTCSFPGSSRYCASCLLTVKYRRRRGGPSKHETIREAGPSNILRDRRPFLRDHRPHQCF